jgi:hypothetical protein
VGLRAAFLVQGLRSRPFVFVEVLDAMIIERLLLQVLLTN